MTTYLIVGVACFISAIVQATMGFGGAVILINVLPFFFPYIKSVAYMQGSLVILNLFYVIVYFKRIRWDVLWPALIPGVLLGGIFSFVTVKIPVDIMTIALGILFICLSFYYLAVVDRIHMVPSKRNGFLMGGFSGLTNAFFGMAGPPVALYFVPSMEDKIEYFVTSQCFFMSSSIACIVVRLFSGVYEVSDIPVIAFLTGIFLFGSFIGLKLLKKIDGKALKKIIYGFIGVNGVYIIVKQLLGA